MEFVLKIINNFIPKKQFTKKSILSFIGSILIAFLVAIIFRSFFFQAFYIPSGSMKPNLLIGDYVVASKFSFGYSKYSLPFNIPLLPEKPIFVTKPKRAEIVIFKYPSDKSKDFVKRVIGLPGDRIQLINSVVYVNNKPIAREYIGETVDNGTEISIFKETYAGLTYKIHQVKNIDNFYLASRNYGPIIVPENHYFMMGDNRDFSKDSRFDDVGFIDGNLIFSKPQVVFFSIDGFFLEIWKWFTDIRWDRIFQSIQS